MEQPMKRFELLAASALAAALCAATMAHAQSFQGTPTRQFNAAVNTSAGRTDVAVTGDRAIIQWSPTDTDASLTAPVDFQPAGTTATFSSANAGLRDFTLLNIIDAPGARAIALNGTVQSRVSDGAGGSVTGGNVWFYSRNGFMVGATARFDVGGLLLTANRPTGIDDPLSPDGFNHQFDTTRQRLTIEPGSAGAITIAAGAEITASSYVALVAPRIVQNGLVRANGEIAYVAGESVDMTMPVAGGLFGIAVVTGSDGTSITHGGTTGGRASATPGQPRNIYMVAVPKNDAVTMLVNGTVGYDTAQSATTLRDGTILLAGAGASVANGAASGPTSGGTISIGTARFTNTLLAAGSNVRLDNVTADGNADLRAQGGAILGTRLTAGGTASLIATNAVSIAANISAGGGVTAQGATVVLNATGPLNVTRATATSGGMALASTSDITLAQADATGAISATSSGGAITAGTVTSGGALTITARSVGFGSITGASLNLNASAGALTGTTLSTRGTALLRATGMVSVANGLTAGGGVDVRGTGIAITTAGPLTLTSAIAIDGDILVRNSGATTLTSGSASNAIDLTGSTVTVGSANAVGLFRAAATGGLAFNRVGGGTVQLDAQGGAITGATLSSTNAATLRASGAITVTSDFAAGAGSSVQGASVALTATGPIALADVGASNGGITLRSGGDLTLAQAVATGAIDLQSTNGAIDAAGLAAGASGVTARGTSVRLRAPGALSVASATATAGDVVIETSGNLALTNGAASGAIRLTSLNGALATGTLTAGTDLQLRSAADLALGDLTVNGAVDLASTSGAITAGTITAAGNVSAAAATSLTFAGISGNALTLTATSGALKGSRIAATGSATLAAGGALAIDTDIAVTDPLNVTGRSISLAATGPVALTSATATGGDLSVTTAGNLAVSSGNATGAIRLISTGGSLTTGTLTPGTDLLLHSASSLTVGALSVSGALDLASTAGAVTATGPLVATGNVSVTAATNLNFTSVSGSAVTLTQTGGALAGNRITATNGATLTAGGALAIDTDLAVAGPLNVTGRSVSLTATGPLALTSATATGGDLSVTTGGNLGVTNGSATGAIRLTSTNGSLTTGTLTPGTDLLLHSAAALTLGNLTVNGAVDLASSGGAISIGAIVAGGDIKAVAATDLGFTSLSGRALTLTATRGALRGNSIAATGGATLTSTGALTIDTDVAVTGGALSVTGGKIALTARSSGLTVAHLAATGTASLVAAGAILSGDISAAGGVTARGTSIDLTAPGVLTLTSASASSGDLVVRTAGDLTLVAGTATRSIALTSTGGAVGVRDASVSGRGDVTLTAATTATLDGTISTAGAVNVTAAAANVSGSVTGRTIAFSTRDMTIGGTAQIGQAGTTTSVSFTNNGTQRSFIGSTAPGIGYTLTAAGLARVQADAITLILPAATDGSAANPDVVIGDLTLHGSTGTAAGTLANLTGAGSLTITTPGRVRVNGAVRLTDLAATNSLRIAAGQQLDIVTPTGAILLTGSTGAPAGSVDLAAGRILVASQRALADLDAISGTDARSTRLATNDGPVTDQGYVAADHVTFRIASLLDVQNSGGSARVDRRGITTGAGGVDVIVTAPGTPEIILNGRQTGGTGETFATGVRVASSGSGQPVPAGGSTVNGCDIVSSLCPTPASPETPSLAVFIPPQDVVGMISEQSDDEDDEKSSENRKARGEGERPLISLARTTPFSYGTIIDEPVTGAPNEDLWIDPTPGEGAPSPPVRPE
jgi:hypothetical protein